MRLCVLNEFYVVYVYVVAEVELRLLQGFEKWNPNETERDDDDDRVCAVTSTGVFCFLFSLLFLENIYPCVRVDEEEEHCFQKNKKMFSLTVLKKGLTVMNKGEILVMNIELYSDE